MTTRLKSWIGLGLLTGFVAVQQMLWSLTDQVPTPQVDSYTYLGNLLGFLDELSQGTWDFPDSFRRLTIAGRPPLYQLMTAPFIWLFGRSESSALAVNLIFIVVLAAATYNLGRLAKNRAAGLLAAFLVLTYPPVVHLSRMYMPYFGSLACAALSLWLLLETVERRSVRVAWLLGLSLAAGLLMHPYFAWTLVGPTIAAGLYMLFQGDFRDLVRSRDFLGWLRKRTRDRFVVRGLVPAALLALVPSSLWYLNLGTAGFRQLDYFSRMDVFLGVREIETPFWWYAFSTPSTISSVLTVILVTGIVLAIVRPRPQTTLLLITLATAYVIYSSLPVRAWWYFCCVLPAAAVLSTAWIVDLKPKWAAQALIAVTLVVGSFNYFLVTWGAAHAWTNPIASALGSPLSDRKTCRDRRTVALCPDQANPEPWPWEEIMAAMLADSRCQAKRQCRLLIVDVHGMAKTWITYLMVRDGHGDRLATDQLLGGQASALDSLLLSDFIAFPGGPAYSRRLRATVGFLQDPPLEFSSAHGDVGTFALPTHRKARVIKRVRPLNLEEIEASSIALGLASDDPPSRVAALLSRAYASTGDTAKALRFFGRIQDPEIERVTRRHVIQELMAWAKHQETQGNRSRAITTYEAILRLNPRHARAREGLRGLQGK